MTLYNPSVIPSNYELERAAAPGVNYNKDHADLPRSLESG